MKKILSAALASSMLLALGTNALALEYNTGANGTANWPTNFKFDGSLFVTDADDNFVSSSTTLLTTKKAADFMPGDVIWMPLYANDQKSFTVTGQETGYPAVSAKTLELGATLDSTTESLLRLTVSGTSVSVAPFTYKDVDNRVIYFYGSAPDAKDVPSNYRTKEITDVKVINAAGNEDYTFANIAEQVAVEKAYDVYEDVTLYYTVAANAIAWSTDAAGTNVVTTLPAGTNNGNPGYTAAATTLAGSDWEAGIDATATVSTPVKVQKKAKVGTMRPFAIKNGVKIRAALPKLDAVTASDGSINNGDNVNEETNNGFVNVAYGNYTDKIDKNWSINLLEKTKGAEEVIEKAEFYRADAADVAMYGKQTSEIKANAVYIKVTLKDYFDSVSDATLKYYVYVANNNGKTTEKTNQVWVEGKYANNTAKYVDFDWSNNANSPAVWQVKKGENGTATFDFQDKAFFTVKMYSEEKMYLDMSTAYDKTVAGDFAEADFDSFFKFKGTNANFSRAGELVLASEDADLFVYEIDADGNLVSVDAEYVKDYKIAHTNTKVNGYKFNTKELGNFVLSADELETAEEEEAVEEEKPSTEKPSEETETPSTNKPNKPNPNTGADDFVGVAVALAVVSVAAAGAVALKK